MLKKVAPMSLAFEYLSFEYNIAIVRWKLFSSVLFWRDLPLFYTHSHGIMGFWVAFATFLVINYIIMGKKQYHERLLSPWCIKYFFHELFSVFLFIFCPVLPQTKASNGGENPFDIKIQIFSDISTIFPIILNLVWGIFSKHLRLKNYQKFWGPMDPVRAN